MPFCTVPEAPKLGDPLIDCSDNDEALVEISWTVRLYIVSIA